MQYFIPLLLPSGYSSGNCFLCNSVYSYILKGPTSYTVKWLKMIFVAIWSFINKVYWIELKIALIAT